MAGTQKKTGEAGKGQVYVTIHKLGSDEEITFPDGESIEHLIAAVGATNEIELKISGRDVRQMDKGTTVGSLAKEGRSGRREVEMDYGSRRGAHGG